MNKLIPVKFEDGTTVYLESFVSRSSDSSQIKEASNIDPLQKSLITAQKLNDSIKAFCGNTINSFNKLEKDSKPSKATVEFGLNITLEGDIYVVKSSSEASIKITAEWNFDNK